MSAKNLHNALKTQNLDSESFMFMKYFDDTAMLVHGQRISLISSDIHNTDEIYIISEEFLICNHSRVSFFSDTRGQKKLTESE